MPIPKTKRHLFRLRVLRATLSIRERVKTACIYEGTTEHVVDTYDYTFKFDQTFEEYVADKKEIKDVEGGREYKLDDPKAADTPWAEWPVDFVVSVDKSVADGELTLWGSYGSYNHEELNIGALAAGQKVKLLADVMNYPITYPSKRRKRHSHRQNSDDGPERSAALENAMQYLRRGGGNVISCNDGKGNRKMKLTEGVLIVENNGEEYIITVGNAAKKFSGMLRLNKTAAFIAHAMQEDVSKEEILGKMLEKYDVSREDVLKSLDNVVNQLTELGILDE